MANRDQSIRRGHDHLRGHVRGNLPRHSRRSCLGRLLALPSSESDGDVAPVQKSSAVGRVRGGNVLHGLASFLVHRSGSRSCHHARSCQGEASGRSPTERSRSAGAAATATGIVTNGPTFFWRRFPPLSSFRCTRWCPSTSRPVSFPAGTPRSSLPTSSLVRSSPDSPWW